MTATMKDAGRLSERLRREGVTVRLGHTRRVRHAPMCPRDETRTKRELKNEMWRHHLEHSEAHGHVGRLSHRPLLDMRAAARARSAARVVLLLERGDRRRVVPVDELVERLAQPPHRVTPSRTSRSRLPPASLLLLLMLIRQIDARCDRAVAFGGTAGGSIGCAPPPPKRTQVVRDRSRQQFHANAHGRILTSLVCNMTMRDDPAAARRRADGSRV